MSGALMFVGTAAVYFLLPIAAPIALVQVVSGARFAAGRLRMLGWLLVSNVLSLPFSIGLLGGFVAPVATAAVSLGVFAMVVGIARGLAEPDRTSVPR